MKESQPDYVSRQQFTSDIVDQLGGNVTARTYENIMGTPFREDNLAAAMPNARAINYVNQAVAPQGGSVPQQMYQNQQPVAAPQQTYMNPQQQPAVITPQQRQNALIKRAMGMAFPGGYGF